MVEVALKNEARRIGFGLCGIAAAGPADGFDRYTGWLADGYHGAMGYLREQAEARRHPESILPAVRSVVMVGLDDTAPAADAPGLALPAAAGENAGKIARFAVGRDYHQAIWRRLDKLQTWIERVVPGSRTRGVADSAPLLERDFARRAGLGWIAKNTMLINKERGSYILLGAVLTDAALSPDVPHDAAHCGTCTACLDACPTDAFVGPGVLDARRCISYLNIEVKGPSPAELRESVGDWLYGCDVCQDVCPWNRKRRTQTVAVDARQILGMDASDFKRVFGATTMARVHRAGLARNAAIVLGNVGDRSALPALQRALDDADEGVRAAAAWAIARVHSRTV
jgi:epoxyqueuosine reductase